MRGASCASSRLPANADEPHGGRIRRIEGARLHDGTDLGLLRTSPAEGAAPSFGQLVSAFREVAAGVEGTHRALIERVEQLSRELESLRSRPQADVACDGTVTLETVERRAILATLERFGGHRDRTARALGIGVRTLGMKLRAWKSAGLVPEHL